MPIVYRLADVFVLPSVGPGEAWGLAINEALASGIPVIASEKCGGSVDLIETSNGIISYKSGDHGKLIKWIKNFKKDECEFLNTMEIHSYQTIIDAIISQIQ